MPQARTLCSAALTGLALSLTPASAQTTTLTSPNSETSGRFGTTVSAVPDVNGDGRGEMAVGSPYENVAGVFDTGRVYLYSAFGLLRLTITSANPENNGLFGFSVSGIQDVNGDTFGDIAIGAPFENPTGPSDSGRAYVYSGASGLRRLTFKSPNAEVGGNFGWSVAGIPDITGDGRGDVAVGAPKENPAGPADAGRVYLYNGFTGALVNTLTSPNAESNGGFGTTVAGVADVNGDGRGDVIVGALFEDPGAAPNSTGRAYVFSGATGALLHTLVSAHEQDDGFFGNSVSGVPDVTGDNRGDVLIGAPYESVGGQPDSSGRAYLFNGATGALLRQFTIGAPVEDDLFGFSVSGCPDLNGDARGDILIGSKGRSAPGHPAGAGRVFVYSGATGAFLRLYGSTGEQVQGDFGASVTGLFDVNADGKGDVGVGAPKENLPAKLDAGRAFIFRN